MKKSIITVLAILLFAPVFAQQVISGNYNDGLTLCYDSSTKKLTGYFEDYTGYDEQTHNARFSCIFYMEGVVTGKKFSVNTYFPTEKKSDQITGTMEIVTNKEVTIKLPQEHGGCWNVQHFTDEPVTFALEKSQPWIQVRYVEAAKAYFYSDKGEDKRMKSYLIKGNVIRVEKIEGQWAYCQYAAQKTTTGWLKLADLNVL